MAIRKAATIDRIVIACCVVYFGVVGYGMASGPACDAMCRLDKVDARLDAIERDLRMLENKVDAMKRARIEYFPTPPAQRGI